MDEIPTPAGPHARFPYGPALLCASCVVMCVWTWMMFSYCWQFTPRELLEQQQRAGQRWPHDSYVSVEGIVVAGNVLMADGGMTHYLGIPDSNRFVCVRSDTITKTGETMRFEGRLHMERQRLYMISCAWILPGSRFHPASIAGLVVMAMGMFVFGIYLRKWRNQCGTSRVDTAEMDF